MREVIQDWLGTRLGILLDMTPQKFSRNTKDGTLLAKLLYNYGVIPVHVFEKVRESKNFYDCYNNLLVLKPWLNYIGVVHEDATLQNMARGEASAAVSIFYAVYLNLERRDRLYYLSLQKERRFSDVSCKFKVDWVPEREVMGDSFETVSKLAFDKNEMIDFHKAKCKEVVEIIKKTKQKFQKMFRKSQPTSNSFVLGQGNNLQPLDKRLKEAEETKETIKAFEKKHPEHSPNLTYSELIQLQNMQEAQPSLSIPNITKAKEIINNIKQRKKSEVYARNFQIEMQHMVLDDQWKIILEKQDKDFENVVCANLLKQSQYEKQMATKLALIRNQKKVLAENRKKIECLKIEQKVKEYEELLGARMEMRGEYWEDEEIEKERTAELHRRIYDERVRMRRKFLKEESQKICDALIDIAIRISDIRELTGCQVPKSFMKDMKELFFKDLSIFDILDNLEELYQKDSGIILGAVEGENGEEEEIIYRNEEYERMKNEEKIRQSVLNECDFFDYLNLLGPWMVELLFPDGSEMEVKQAVLGYIVHKVLTVKYPAPNIPAPVPIKPMKPTAVVLGLADDVSVNMLLDLMELCKVLVVRVDDAINFVLATYKKEMSVVKDIDITFQKATANALKGKTNNGKEKEVKKKIQLLKKDSEKAMPLEENMNVIDKQTQTPRMIPEDDPLLSPNAELGKMAFEALGSGDPVPDSVIVSAVAAYVVSKQDDYNGWVLLNYPLLYPQASELECVLTGYRILPILDDVESIEDVEGFTYRESCVNPFSKNDFADRQISRLVPKPDVFATPTEIPKSYFESFIVMKKMSDSIRWKSQDSISFGPMERFYSDQDILFNFEYSSLNFQSIKNLGKAILGEIYQPDDRDSLLAKNSLEIFGENVLELNEKWDPSKKKNVKETATKKVVKEPTKLELLGENSEEMVEVIKPPELPPTQVKPGDPDWEWATGRQPEHFLMSLASLWENMETVYIEDFKDVFFTLRVHHANVLSYSSFIRHTTRALMRRPDEKQRVLSDFHKMFNDIDEDLRPDVDIKCELHVRVSELEEALMQIADERKANSLNDLKKVGQDGWVADEMASLVNAYLTALQLEADRCINSCQMIMDYYITLQQKLPDEKPLNKVVVAKLQIKDRKYSIASSPSNKSNLITPRNNEFKKSNKSLMDQVKSSHDRVSKTRSWMEKRKRSSDATFLTGAADVITEILVNLSLPDDGLTPFHNFFIDSFQVVINEVKDTVEGCISESKRGDKTLPKNPKKMSETKISVNGNLNIEWLTALENELSRFLFRVKLILARGIFEMNEFLTTILNILSSLAEDINEMYLKETHSISECCKVFRCGIEEEIGIQPYLELKEDEFIVDEENPLFSNHQEIVSIVVDEYQKFRFTIEQLSLICQKLQRVAPDGEIIKMSLLYILEDLRVLKSEGQNSNCFPDIWKMIEPDDLTYILNEIYKDLEIVHWKDFIIYAMDLPVPTEAEILHTRKSFRLFDPNVTELVSRENYDTVRFWFEATLDHYTQVDRNEKAKDLLYRMYQVDEHQSNYSALLLAFCKDDNPVLGFTKALALAMGKRINVVEYPEDLFPVGGENGEGDYLGLFDDVSSISIKKPDCCRVSFMESQRKCIPKEKIPTCDCQYYQKSLISEEEEEEEEEEMSFSEKGGEGSLYFEHSLPNSVASTIPINILSSLLKASYQSLPQLSILLDCKQTFQETLNSIYDSLESHDGSVDVYKLIHHKFISRLLQTTNKFKFINIRHILMTVVEFKNSMGRTPCYLDKLNVNFCLN